jgi:hypothetical protein
MKNAHWLVLASALALPAGASAQEQAWQDEPQARIWLDRGDQPVLQRGDRVRVYYRTSEDAYVAIFHVDTDGVVRLLHPRGPGEDSFTRGGRDYRLLFPQWSYWYVDEYPGKGYFFAVASPWPLDLSQLDYARQDRSWDLTRAGRSVYRDPYLAMDDYVALLIPDWETVPYALDFLEYDVGEVHQYPRFLCYDCHGFRSYVAWNPYTYACSSFRVVVWDDPYFYPAVRYGPTRVVYTAPRRAVARFEFKERAAGETWTPLVRTREAQPRRGVDYVEPSVAPGASPDRGGATPRPSAGRPVAAPRNAEPAPAVTPQTRRPPTPAGGSPSRTAQPAPAASPDQRRPTEERPVLQRRPSTSTGASAPSTGAARQTPSGRATATPTRTSTPPSQSRPSAAPPASGGSRPQAQPSSRGSSKPPAATRPPANTRPPAASSGSRGTGTKTAQPARRPPPTSGGS